MNTLLICLISVTCVPSVCEYPVNLFDVLPVSLLFSKMFLFIILPSIALPLTSNTSKPISEAALVNISGSGVV